MYVSTYIHMYNANLPCSLNHKSYHHCHHVVFEVEPMPKCTEREGHQCRLPGDPLKAHSAHTAESDGTRVGDERENHERLVGATHRMLTFVRVCVHVCVCVPSQPFACCNVPGLTRHSRIDCKLHTSNTTHPR